MSRAPGFPGFLKCLQREPGFGRVRGVHLVSGDADPCVLPAIGACNERVADLKKAIVARDARFAVLNVSGTSLSVELPYYDSNEQLRRDVGSSFPAPFGRFLVFPQPGNLEAYKWKAHAHPSMLLGEEKPAKTAAPGVVASSKAVARIKLPAGSAPLPLDSSNAGAVEIFIPEPQKDKGDPTARKDKYMAFSYGDETAEGSGAGKVGLLGSLFGGGKNDGKASQANGGSGLPAATVGSPTDAGANTAAQNSEKLQGNHAAA